MDKLIGFIIIIFLIVLVIVYVVLPILGVLLGIGLALLGGTVILGFVSGMFVGFKNFIDVLIEAHQRLP